MTTPKQTPTEPISDGPNARPRDESIAQSAEGLPNDTSKPIEVDALEEQRIREKLLGAGRTAEPDPAS